MSNPNNCTTCEYKHARGPGCFPQQHCYMFYEAPTEQCMQHTGYREQDRKLNDLLRVIITHKESS